MDKAWDRDDGPAEPPAWPEDAEIPLCPHCLHETRMGAHFCHRCLAPLTFYAATAWLERTWSWPWVIGEAMHARGSRLVHPLGVTFLFGLEFVAAALLFLFDGWAGAGVQTLLPEIILIPAWLVLASVFIVRAWLNWARHRHEDPWAGADGDGLPGEPAIHP